MFNEFNDAICPYAYSYILWRFYIERLDDPSQVGRIKPIRWFRQDIEILPRNEIDFVKDIINQWLSKFRNNILSNKILFEWVFTRLIVFLIYNSFLNILSNVAKGLIEQNISIRSKVLNTVIPFFLIVFPDNSNDCAEFHWWTCRDMDIKEVEKTLNCPNPSIKKRKKYEPNGYSNIDLYDSRLDFDSGCYAKDNKMRV